MRIDLPAQGGDIPVLTMIHIQVFSFLQLALQTCPWKPGSSVGSGEKHFKDPHTGSNGVTSFIYEEKSKELPSWVPNVPFPSVLPWRKSNHVFIQVKTKASVQNVYFILKLHPLETVQSPWVTRLLWSHVPRRERK